jgi:hypothetical protein
VRALSSRTSQRPLFPDRGESGPRLFQASQIGLDHNASGLYSLVKVTPIDRNVAHGHKIPLAM